ncbi:MAG: hypothetical protein GX181_01635 [Synergistaceae bacterium]|nr:V-type ATP synthase subunit E [Synergistota bacterium]NLM70648.1 hypothetical protein [Synergistaceae bacterium]
MSLADIKKKIESDAREEAERILAKAREDAESIKKSADLEIKSVEDGYASRFKGEQPEIFRRREIVAALDVKKLELGVKQRAITDAFEGAVKILATLPDDKYFAFIGDLMKKAVQSGTEQVLVSKSEKRITADWLAKLNEANGWSLKLGDEKRDISGGFYLEQDDIETDCSFEMLVRWVRDEIEADVVKRLFSA